MKSLFIVNDFPPIVGGQSRYLYNLLRCFPHDKVIVLAPYRKDCQDFDKKQKFTIIRKHYLFPFPGINRILKIIIPMFHTLVLLKKYRIKHIHCAHILSTGVVGLILKKVLNLSYFVYTYSADIMSYQNIALIKRLMFHILQNATKVVAISDYNQEKLVRLGVSSDKIVKIMPKIDLDEFRQRPDCHDLVTKYNLHNKKVVLSVNRLVERKGNDVMIKAFRKVKEKHANAVYVIVGSGAYKKCLEDLVLVSHLHNEIIFVDSASDQEVIKFLYICDVFVMLSREIKEKGDAEGFGIVFLEANACHKPVIGGKSGGVPDAIIDGQTGLLVDPLDINAISQAVLKLLGDPSYAAQLGEAGYDRVKNQFDWREGIYQMKKTGLFDS